MSQNYTEVQNKLTELSYFLSNTFYSLKDRAKQYQTIMGDSRLFKNLTSQEKELLQPFQSQLRSAFENIMTRINDSEAEEAAARQAAAEAAARQAAAEAAARQAAEEAARQAAEEAAARQAAEAARQAAARQAAAEAARQAAEEAAEAAARQAAEEAAAEAAARQAAEAAAEAARQAAAEAARQAAEEAAARQAAAEAARQAAEEAAARQAAAEAARQAAEEAQNSRILNLIDNLDSELKVKPQNLKKDLMDAFNRFEADRNDDILSKEFENILNIKNFPKTLGRQCIDAIKTFLNSVISILSLGHYPRFFQTQNMHIKNQTIKFKLDVISESAPISTPM